MRLQALPRLLSWLGILIFCMCGSSVGSHCAAQETSIDSAMQFLRSGSVPEWSGNPVTAPHTTSIEFDWQLDFPAVTLLWRQKDVKERWRIRINDSPVGELVRDENYLEGALEVSSDHFQRGLNRLTVEAASAQPDDIEVGDWRIIAAPKAQALAESVIELRALDSKNESLACRFTVLDEKGCMVALATPNNPMLAIRSGVVYSALGVAEFGIRKGSYHVFCGRGLEYSIDRQTLSVDEHRQLSTFHLRREVETQGMIACDTHVHTLEVSGHGDASLAERMVTLAGEGVELAVATDHNTFVDYRDTLAQMNFTPSFTPMIGNEVTTKFGHFNVFPADKSNSPPNHLLEEWKSLHESIRETTGAPYITLNHPRDTHAGFTPFAPENMLRATGRRLDNRALFVTAIELINSAAMQSDVMQLFHDWNTQINRGYPLHAVGSSDSHEVSMKIVGQGRTYIYAPDSKLSEMDEKSVVDAMKAGKTLVSLGLLCELFVDDHAISGDLVHPTDDMMKVRIKVQGPSWIQADVVELYSNGELIQSCNIAADQQRSPGVKFDASITIPKPSHDVQLIAVARGPGVTEFFWPIAKPYQPTSPEWHPYVFACSGIIRIDSNDDQQWTSSLQYAEQVVRQANGSLQKLVNSLADFDVPVVVFAADLWTQQGHSLAINEQMPPHVQTGFRRWIESDRESTRARINAGLP